MRSSIWVQILALPACLREVYAEQLQDSPHIGDNAIYDSGLGGNQEVIGGLPCPDYTRYATLRQ